MEKINTFIIPVIRTDLLQRCLETLYRYTPPNFYVYVIDQSVDGIDKPLHKYIHMYVRPYRNLGFAKAINTGVKLAETKYVTPLNDDVEFINYKWWQGIMDTFKLIKKTTPDRPAVMVNPATIKLPDWSVNRPKGDDFYILPYKEWYTEEDWDFLLNEDHYINERLTLKPGSVIDGVTMWCPVMHRERFLECEMLDEDFYPGGGEDYDFNCRANAIGYRSVGTTLSYTFHHWGKTLSKIQELPQVDKKYMWNNNDEKWGNDFALWGKDRKIPPTGRVDL